MIGTKFSAPLEFKIVTDKEIYLQGDPIKGDFIVKNHGASSLTLSLLQVSLESGIFKKINQKEDKGFTQVDVFNVNDKISLKTGEQKSMKWNFLLKEDCPITDTQQSLYIVYGNSRNPFECGQLQLTVAMAPILKFFLEVFVNFHRFQIKQTKFSKDMMVEIKLSPPKSREMTSVEGLVLQMKKDKDNLIVNYHFSVKKLESVSTTEAKVQSKKMIFDQILTKNDYEEYGSFSHEKVKEQIGLILKEVIPKFFF